MKVQRGFTLVELAIVAGIVALLAMGAVFALGNRPYAVRSSVMVLNATFSHARAIAESSGNGATVVVAPHDNGSVLYLFRGRPNDPASMAQATARAEVEASLSEATVGPAPFAIFMAGDGHVTALGSYPPLRNGEPSAFPALATAPPCPPGGLTITAGAGRASEPVTLGC